MASAPDREAAVERRGRFLELLMGSGSGPDGDPFVFFPILVGFMGPPRGGETDSSSPVDRIVLVNPMTQGMVVLRAGGGSPDLAAVMEEILAAEGGARGTPPASKASIEAMGAVERPKGEAVDEVEEECSVCLDGLWSLEEDDDEAGAEKKKVDVVKEMPCKHRFHGGCIEKWLGMHGSCPVCRYQMPEEKEPERKKEGEEREQERRRGLEREIWVTLGFSRRAAEQLQQPQQGATDEEARDGP